MCLLIRCTLYIYVCVHMTKTTTVSVQYADVDESYNEMIELNNTIQMTSSLRLTRCLAQCNLNDRCVSFFYNNNTLQCVLHSTTFVFTTLGTMEDGWRFFVLRDVTGRCPYPYTYYRSLDFCYQILANSSANFQGMRDLCNSDGGQLAAIESKEKNDYFKHILQNRPYTQVGLGTRPQNGVWVKDSDGKPLTYFNWAPNQPNGGSCMRMKADDLQYDCPCGSKLPRVFACEI